MRGVRAGRSEVGSAKDSDIASAGSGLGGMAGRGLHHGNKGSCEGTTGLLVVTSPPMGSEMFSVKLRPGHSAGRRQDGRVGVPGPLSSNHRELALHLAS